MAGKLNVAGKLNRTPQGEGVKVGVEIIYFCGGNYKKKKCAAGANKLVGVILTVYQAVAGKLPRGRKTKSDPIGGCPATGPLATIPDLAPRTMDLIFFPTIFHFQKEKKKHAADRRRQGAAAASFFLFVFLA